MPSPTITYSPAYTLVPTYECFNRCTYCNFRTDPGQDTWLTLDRAEQILRSIPAAVENGLLQPQGVVEILILSGEVHPQHPQRSAWFQRIYDLCELALNLGFLPHTNAGILSFEEMARLKMVNVSMGLMLEQMTPTLLETVHRHAPSKIPAVRQQQLEWAGELQIPFTTGLLLGIGETEADWTETLQTIAQLHDRYRHIQEVILQPHSPGEQQTCQGEAFAIETLPQVVQLARTLLPPDIALQIPPNLIPDLTQLVACLDAGAGDLGGIGPKDEVNPDYPHSHDADLAAALEHHGWQLTPRLPIYPQYDDWLTLSLKDRVKLWRDSLGALQSKRLAGSGSERHALHESLETSVQP